MVDDNQQATEQDFVIRTVDDFEQQIIDNKAIIQAYNERYLQEKSTDAEWHLSGNIQKFERIKNGILIHLDNGVAQLIWINPQTLHLRIAPQAQILSDYFSYFVADTLKTDLVDLVINDTATELSIAVGGYQYTINKSNLAMTCSHNDSVQWAQSSFNWTSDLSEVGVHIQLHADEACYGTGERAFGLNLRGRQLPIWNTDPGGYARGDDPINACVPFYLGVHNTAAYGVLWDDSSRALFDIGASHADELRITGETNTLSCYFFTGKTASDVLSLYSNVTGYMQMPPLWALGYHQSRYSYMSADEVLSVARELREREIPCDVIYLDIHYMSENRVFTWNQANFPDMAGMIEQLHAMNMRIIPILDPGIKAEVGYVGHDTGVEADVFVKYPDGEYAAGVVWPGLCYFPDFTSENVRTWWVEQLAPLLETGIDGIWNDMNEPLIFDNVSSPVDLPDYVQHDKEGHGGTHLELHNVYGTVMAQASLQALEKHRPNQRQFTFTRACTAGTQRIASSWTGDNHSTWDDLHIAISTSLQMGLSGIAFTGSDIGGFMKDTTGELLTRWTQAGALMPFFRNHSAVDVIHQEPWQFGDVYEKPMREAIQLRYQLMPYIYTAFAQHAMYGTPIIRPIFMAEPNNPTLRDIDDSFMLGDTLLIAPILKPKAIRRTVYLPEGDWYNYHTNERYHGGTLVRVEAPLDYIPIFVKSGTVLPLWDTLQHLTNPAIETLKLRVYTDSGETTLYEDAGEGLSYREGAFRWVNYQAEEHTDRLTLTRQVVGDYTPSYKQIELQLIGSRSEITRIDVDGLTHFDFDTSNGINTITVKADFKQATFLA